MAAMLTAFNMTQVMTVVEVTNPPADFLSPHPLGFLHMVVNVCLFLAKLTALLRN
jgi:hypothetical protein